MLKLVKFFEKGASDIAQKAANLIGSRRQQLEMLQLRVAAADPARILGNGFAIVATEGRRASLKDIVEGARLKLVLGEGEVEFVVGEVVGKRKYRKK